MDVISYLLGKNSSGGGGGGGTNLDDYFNKTITPSGNREYQGEWVKYVKNLPKIEQTFNSLTYLFYGAPFETIDLSGFINNNIDMTQYMFYNCTNLKNIIWGNFEFNSYLISIKYMFYGCTSLESVDLFYTGKVTNFSHSFRMCTNLKDVPLFDTSKATDFTSMFANCTSLTDTSLDNILQMCINATEYTGTKTLATLGFTSGMATTEKIEGLPHYSDFTTAGWTIGY